MLSVGVIGCGYWGPNLIRNFIQLKKSHVHSVADLDESRLAHMKQLYPSVRTTQDYKTIISNKNIDAIAVATPIKTHFKIASEALSAGKHVFVEKPIAGSAREAEKLTKLARKKRLKLMVGHIFLYTGAVNKMKEIVDSGELGKIYYVNSQRLNLGLFQQDINVIWDLAPHDISIILHLLGQEPESVTAVGASHIHPSVEDIAVLTMRFKKELVAFVQSSWLDPDKIRKLTIVGSKKMLIYDDVQPTEKIRIYNKGRGLPEHYDTFAEFPYSFKYGDTIIPKLEGSEPLQTQLNHFLDCIIKDEEPLTNGENGVAVVRILENAQKSIIEGNSWVDNKK